MLVKNAVSLFLLSLDGSKSPQTVTWYQRRLHPLVASLGDTPLETVTIADLRRLRADLSSRSTRYEDHPYRPVVNGRGLSPYTIHGHLRARR